jgi:hypothetical protein
VPSPEETPHYHGHRDGCARASARRRRRPARLRAARTRPVPLHPRIDTKPLAKELRRFGGFAEVVAALAGRLRRDRRHRRGDDHSTSRSWSLRPARAKGAVSKRPVLSSWSSVIDYCRTTMAFAEKEQLRLLSSTSATSSSPTKCSSAAHRHHLRRLRRGGDSTERLIPFDIIPRVLMKEEWDRCRARPSKQRVKRAQHVPRDIYGKQEISAPGIVPPTSS